MHTTSPETDSNREAVMIKVHTKDELKKALHSNKEDIRNRSQFF